MSESTEGRPDSTPPERPDAGWFGDHGQSNPGGDQGPGHSSDWASGHAPGSYEDQAGYGDYGYRHTYDSDRYGQGYPYRGAAQPSDQGQPGWYGPGAGQDQSGYHEPGYGEPGYGPDPWYGQQGGGWHQQGPGGWGYGGGWGHGGGGWGQGPPHGNYGWWGGEPSWVPPQRRRTVPSIVVVLLIIAAAAIGLGVGHSAWSSSSNSSANGGSFQAPNNGFAPGSGGFGSGGSGSNGGSASNGGSNTNGAGGPSNAASIAAKIAPDLVDIDTVLSYQQAEAAGTGIVIDSKGIVLTNNHVIDGATKISVTDVGNGKTYSATVVGYDTSHDIAVLQLKDASGLPAAPIGDSSKVSVNQPIVAVGNAGGKGGTPSYAGGSVTALNQSITAQNELDGLTEKLTGLIQVNAGIQSGDSGGSLVNIDGQVVGIDTAASQGYSFSSGNEGFAIPINGAMTTAKQIRAGTGSSTVHIGATAFLGVLINLQGGAPAAPGVSISSVVSGGPAASAGLGAGSVITSLDNKPTTTAAALSELLIPLHPGQRVAIAWTDSGGQSHTGTITLGSGPPA